MQVSNACWPSNRQNGLLDRHSQTTKQWKTETYGWLAIKAANGRNWVSICYFLIFYPGLSWQWLTAKLVGYNAWRTHTRQAFSAVGVCIQREEDSIVQRGCKWMLKKGGRRVLLSAAGQRSRTKDSAKKRGRNQPHCCCFLVCSTQVQFWPPPHLTGVLYTVTPRAVV